MRLKHLIMLPLIRLWMHQGRRAEKQNDLTAAFDRYEQAARAGSAEAMLAIGELYMHKGFRPVRISGLMQQLIQGQPAFPWNAQDTTAPDMQTALTWFRRAAEAGHARGMTMAGSILCDGKGVPADRAEGIAYLEQAVQHGDPIAGHVLALYVEPPRTDIPDAQYDALLDDFAAAVDGKRTEQFALYQQLKSGSDAQRARLGYLLLAAHGRCKPGYEKFRYPRSRSGIPQLPVAARRGAWQSFVRIDLNAIAREDALIAFTADFGAEYCLQHLHRLELVGEACYRSSAFGWLKVDKRALLLRIAPAKPLPGHKMKKVAADFCLTEDEYAPDHVAFFTENGEKEYSAEIAVIHGAHVDVLCRYTIGGSERIEQAVQPELISMTLHN